MQPVIKKIKPLFGRVLIQKYVPGRKTPGGVLLPENKSSNIGVVLEVGAGRNFNDGKDIANVLKAGQYVLLPEYGGTKVPKSDGKDKEELVIYKEEDIIAVLDGEFNTKI